MYSKALLSQEVESLLDLSDVQVKNLTNPVLLDQTLSLVREERRLGIGIVNRLKEISRRGLHLEQGYSSLFTFLVAELKYPEATAYRLVSAMELLKAVPEVEEKIKNGSMSVSTASQVQSYFKAQGRENSISFNLEEKQEIIRAVESQTTRETEKILANLHPDLPLKQAEERARPTANNQTVIQFTASVALMKKLSRIKDLSAHKNWNPSYAELFEMLADVYLEKNDPVIKAERIAKKAEGKGAKEDARASKPAEAIKNPEALPVLEVPVKAPSRVIPASVRYQVYSTQKSQCAFISKMSGKQCSETKGLQLDHRIPWAKGGQNTAENLRLLCARHNYWAAVKSYGSVKMSQFVRDGGP